MKVSHPTWVRGLKQDAQVGKQKIETSHPTWVRGLKLGLGTTMKAALGRTLRGCVD